MKLGEAKEILQQMERDYNVNKTIKDSMMNLPDKDMIQLLGKFSTPDHFQPDSNDAVTRENATGDLSDKELAKQMTVGSIRSTFIRLFKKDYPDDQYIKEVIDLIGDDIIIRATNSKSRNGILLNLVVTSKKIAEVATRSLSEAGKSIFSLGKK